MFVFPHKLILKTCGTTTLLLGLERILQIASSTLANVSHQPASLEMGRIVKRCFYSRKSFMFPERQKGPHKDWMLEVGLLDRFFEQGSAYTVGKMNGDHWLLYMTSPSSFDSGSTTGQVERPLRLPSIQRPQPLSDQTLEILMTYLSPNSCSRFEFPSEILAPNKEQITNCSINDRGHLLGTRLSDQLGLTTLFPNTTLDAFAFEPCGFSANAVINGNGKAVEDGYWTVHVTPEQDSSYASFETNMHMDETGGVDKKDLPWLISRVLSIFEPSRLSVTLFTSSDNLEEQSEKVCKGQGQGQDQDQGDILHSLQLKNYKRTDRIAYEFEDYDLVFVSFDKQGVRLPRR
jgi:S-adenosylmethionine decarboxylase